MAIRTSTSSALRPFNCTVGTVLSDCTNSWPFSTIDFGFLEMETIVDTVYTHGCLTRHVHVMFSASLIRIKSDNLFVMKVLVKTIDRREFKVPIEDENTRVMDIKRKLELMGLGKQNEISLLEAGRVLNCEEAFLSLEVHCDMIFDYNMKRSN